MVSKFPLNAHLPYDKDRIVFAAFVTKVGAEEVQPRPRLESTRLSSFDTENDINAFNLNLVFEP